MSEKVLFVDDDPNILAAFQRQLRRQYTVETALGGKEGLDAIVSQGPYSVIVSDLRMPEMNGIQFLSRVRVLAPESVRMMLTGNADVHAAIEAVNEGNIFRFLTKPCSLDALTTALAAGMEQYRLVIAERELLEKTLRGSIKVLTEVLALLNPEAFGRASRITRYVRAIALEMKVADVWRLETAATLSQIGCVIFPEEVLRKLYQGRALMPEESQLFNMHPFVASDLLAHIPRMQKIAEIIAYQEKHFDGSGIPHDSTAGEDIPLGARILKVVLDFDTLETGGAPRTEIIGQLRQKSGCHDPRVLAALHAVITIEEGYETRILDFAQIEVHMILGEDVLTRDGRLLITRGYQVSRTLLERLRNFAQKPGIREPIRVHVPVTKKPTSLK